MLYKSLEVKDSARINETKDKTYNRGEYPESWKPLQYHFYHYFHSGIIQALSRGATISSERYYPLENPKVEVRTYIKLKLFDN